MLQNFFFFIFVPTFSYLSDYIIVFRYRWTIFFFFFKFRWKNVLLYWMKKTTTHTSYVKLFEKTKKKDFAYLKKFHVKYYWSWYTVCIFQISEKDIKYVCFFVKKSILKLAISFQSLFPYFQKYFFANFSQFKLSFYINDNVRV